MSASFTVNPEVVVVGAGVSGLSACYFLNRKGLRPLLLESSGRLGGLIRTDRIEGCDLEAGPDSFIAAKTSVAALAQELHIADRIIGSNDAARRIFIQRRGKLIPMPKGMKMMVPSDLRAALTSPLFSVRTKLRFLREQWCAPRSRKDDVSIARFVEDHFGTEMINCVAEPLLVGVYGGDAGRLSAFSVLPRFVEYERQYGSLVKAVRAEAKPGTETGSLFLSFAGGMQTLIDALSRAIDRATDIQFTKAKAVQRTESGWCVLTEQGSIAAKHVVLACPAYVSADLLRDSAPALSAHLNAIPYSSAILVTLVYSRVTLGHPQNGFGLLVPRRERRDVAAVTWVSTKFPSRTPPEFAALRGFIVGERAAELMSQPDSQLVDRVRSEFRTVMRINAEPVFSTVYRWPDSMPQYVVGHQSRRDAIAQALSGFPGLSVCGNAYEGVGIPDCIRLSRQVVAAIPSDS